MDTYLYLSVIPEALVVSMLPAKAFGRYLATGTQKRPHGQAVFFQIKQDSLTGEYFNLAAASKKCVPHPDGVPKHSVYIAVYRVLEHVPLDAIGGLFLATAHGKVLEIERAEAPSRPSGRYHLYQELCPVHPLVASSLNPSEFCRFITDTTRAIHVPRICFVELDPGDLADDPTAATAADLPYRNIAHIRECISELEPLGSKETKTVDRIGHRDLIYRSIKTGFYVGDQDRTLCYPYPTAEDLQGRYYNWWRCANDSEIVHGASAI